MEQTKLEHYLKACVPLIYVRTSEDSRGVKHIMDAVNKANLTDCFIAEWTCNRGLVVNGERQSDRDTISKALNYLISSEDTGILIVHNIRQFISNFMVIQDLKDALMVCRVRGSYIILIGAEIEFPPEIKDLVTICDFPLPDKEFFTGIFSEMVGKYKDSMELPYAEEEKTTLIGKAASAALGMNAIQGESSMALSIVKTRTIDLQTIYTEKEACIKQSDVLELVQTHESLDTLGGFDQFKKWVGKRVNGFSQEALDYGLRPPRGILLVGVPGCICGDTRIPISRKIRSGGYREIRLEELYYRFNNLHKKGVEKGIISKFKKPWDDKYTTKTLSYKEDAGYIGYNEILGVVDSGIKQLYEIETDFGTIIRATKDHKFCTPNGYVPLENLCTGDSIVSYKKGDLLYCHTTGRNTKASLLQINNVGKHPNARIRPRVQKIWKIRFIGDRPTYDIQMKDPYNNFVADGLIVHNSGKSLCAKVLASYFGVPLIKFDIGKVFRSLQGSSESAVRQALRVADAAAPAILWIEELEKSMAGTESSGKTDSGTTARIMQTILTWMNDKQTAVFVAATANKVEAIPPELLRKGRFDEVFGVDLPVQNEREEIFAIHIRKRNRKIEDYDLVKLGEKTEGYTGAEIEAAIDDAMATAFSDNIREFTTEDILLSVSDTIPQSSSQREKISAIRDWITTRTRLVSSQHSPKWNIGAGKEILEETRKVRNK